MYIHIIKSIKSRIFGYKSQIDEHKIYSSLTFLEECDKHGRIYILAMSDLKCTGR